MADFMFVVFAGLALLGGLVVAFGRTVVHSVFGLVAALFGVGGLYWTVGADFLGATQILLYVGGVTVLLLFAVMLTTTDTRRVSIPRTLLMVPVVGFLALQVLQAYRGVVAIVGDVGHVPPVAETGAGTTPVIGELLVAPDGYLVPFEVAAVLLLVVLVGAVTIARQRDETRGGGGRRDRRAGREPAGSSAHGAHGGPALDAHAPHAGGAVRTEEEEAVHA